MLQIRVDETHGYFVFTSLPRGQFVTDISQDRTALVLTGGQSSIQF
jgi:hypothetical protein